MLKYIDFQGMGQFIAARMTTMNGSMTGKQFVGECLRVLPRNIGLRYHGGYIARYIRVVCEITSVEGGIQTFYCSVVRSAGVSKTIVTIDNPPGITVLEGKVC